MSTRGDFPSKEFRMLESSSMLLTASFPDRVRGAVAGTQAKAARRAEDSSTRFAKGERRRMDSKRARSM